MQRMKVMRIRCQCTNKFTKTGKEINTLWYKLREEDEIRFSQNVGLFRGQKKKIYVPVKVLKNER